MHGISAIIFIQFLVAVYSIESKNKKENLELVAEYSIVYILQTFLIIHVL